MRVQVVRSKQGRVAGIALLRGEGTIIAVQDEREELWRYCDGCAGQRLAVVFCRAHVKYLCVECLGFHNKTAVCSYISMSVAREISDTALIRAEVEA
jgi:hypothetical protein